MATNNAKTSNSRHSPTPLQPTSPASLVEHTSTNTAPPSPPSHPPLQYDNPQSFRAYTHSIVFEDDDLFSTDDMFANPMPLPELEVASIIQRAEQRQQQQQQRTREHAPAPEHTLPNLKPVPELGIPSIIIHRAEQQQQQQQRTRDYPPARGTGLGKTKADPKKRVRFDSPQPGREERGGAAGALGEMGRVGGRRNGLGLMCLVRMEIGRVVVVVP